MLAHGDKVKDYEIIAPIRSGGMAMLYLARRRGVGGFSRLVALKLVHPHLIDDRNINRLFLQEARIAASVAHPNVVHVEEVGTADGKYFIAMEYLHGVSLDQFLASLSKQRRRMSAKLCIWIAAQISEALHAVHEATLENGVPLNIVHRDVSPQNVLIGHNGHIKLIDFGIAKSQLMSYQASRGGSILGKLRYMAPEQLQLKPVSRRTDVYALGVMLWEMLASRNLLRCFRIDDERDWQTRENPPAPSKHAPNLTPQVDQAVLKAIACNADERYENALSFRRAMLRAEPSASQVDAPAFAALIHHLLGDELAKRRAEFPNEVNVQLDSDVVSDVEPSLKLEELTAKIRPSEAADAPYGEESEEPTQTAAQASARAEFNDDETVIRSPHASHKVQGFVRKPAPAAQIATPRGPVSLAPPRAPLGRALLQLAERNHVVQTAALALLVALAAYVAASAPRLSLHLLLGDSAVGSVSRGFVRESRPGAPPAPRNTKGARVDPRKADAQASDVSLPPLSLPPLRLHETQIVSTAEVSEPKAPAARSNAPAAPGRKRVAAHPRPARAKGKAVAVQGSAKVGRH